MRLDERKLRIRMAEMGIRSIEELSRRSGVTRVTIYNMLSGEDYLVETLAKIAKALECNPFDILDMSEFSPHAEAPASAS